MLENKSATAIAWWNPREATETRRSVNIPVYQSIHSRIQKFSHILTVEYRKWDLQPFYTRVLMHAKYLKANKNIACLCINMANTAGDRSTPMFKIPATCFFQAVSINKLEQLRPYTWQPVSILINYPWLTICEVSHQRLPKT